MTVIDKFIAFANGLPADQRESVEEALAALMESMSDSYDLTPDELAEIDRRVAEPNPEFSDPADIAKIFGKPDAELTTPVPVKRSVNAAALARLTAELPRQNRCAVETVRASRA